MHHPPIATGLPALDAIGLRAADATGLAALLPRAPQVRRIAAGHVHRTAAGSLGGRDVLTCASTHRNTRLEIGAPEFDLVPGGPSLVLHVLLDSGALVSHVEPIHD